MSNYYRIYQASLICQIFNGDHFGKSESIRFSELSEGFLSQLPLSVASQKDQGLSKRVASAISYSQNTGRELVIVSSICPDYESDKNGKPTYQGLGGGISPNTRTHLSSVPLGVLRLREQGINAHYLVLLADTEVDLLPFLVKLKLSQEEFVSRCQSSIDVINHELTPLVGTAYRFLDFFGRDSFNQVYKYSYQQLVNEYNSGGKETKIVDRDLEARQPLINTLLGDVTREEGLNHLFRQRAQYVTFARLIRQYANNRTIVVNHTTPNFVLMNHHLAREISPEQSIKGNYEPILPLVELNISTLPQ